MPAPRQAPKSWRRSCPNQRGTRPGGRSCSGLPADLNSVGAPRSKHQITTSNRDKQRRSAASGRPPPGGGCHRSGGFEWFGYLSLQGAYLRARVGLRPRDSVLLRSNRSSRSRLRAEPRASASGFGMATNLTVEDVVARWRTIRTKRAASIRCRLPDGAKMTNDARPSSRHSLRSSHAQTRRHFNSRRYLQPGYWCRPERGDLQCWLRDVGPSAALPRLGSPGHTPPDESFARPVLSRGVAGQSARLANSGEIVALPAGTPRHERVACHGRRSALDASARSLRLSAAQRLQVAAGIAVVPKHLAGGTGATGGIDAERPARANHRQRGDRSGGRCGGHQRLRQRPDQRHHRPDRILRAVKPGPTPGGVGAEVGHRDTVRRARHGKRHSSRFVDKGAHGDAVCLGCRAP